MRFSLPSCGSRRRLRKSHCPIGGAALPCGGTADRETLRQGWRSPAESHRTRGSQGLAGESAAQRGSSAGRILLQVHASALVRRTWFRTRISGPADQAGGRPVRRGGGLYDPTTLRTIFLQFENTEWERELADFNNTDVEVPPL